MYHFLLADECVNTKLRVLEKCAVEVFSDFTLIYILIYHIYTIFLKLYMILLCVDQKFQFKGVFCQSV